MQDKSWLFMVQSSNHYSALSDDICVMKWRDNTMKLGGHVLVPSKMHSD
jgi:hypothetical protein